jgi:hypothetical protein
MMTERLHRQEKNNGQRETSAAESQDRSRCVHLRNGLTAPGLSARADGRAKSPVLNASALAVV